MNKNIIHFFDLFNLNQKNIKIYFSFFNNLINNSLQILINKNKYKYTKTI